MTDVGGIYKPVRKRLRPRGVLPVDGFAVAPEVVQVVVGAGFGGEDVDHHRHEVDQDPVLAFIPGPREGLVAQRLGHVFDVVGHAAHLAGAGAGGDDEVIGDRAYTADIEH